MKQEDLIFKFKSNEYKITVDDYESGFIKVSMQDIKSKKIQDITIDGVEYVIPQAPTPNCAMIQNNQELTDELLKAQILTSCHSLMATFNMKELYKYDQLGVKAFLEKYAHNIEYVEDKGNSPEEIKKNIRKDAREILNSKEVRKKLRDNYLNMKYFCYSILNKDNLKESYAVFCDEEGNGLCLVSPYIKGIDDQLEYVPDYAYSNREGLFSALNRNCQIIQIDKDSHEWIIEELEYNYPDFEYKKGVQKYLKYCINQKIDKEEFIKKYKEIEKLFKKEREKKKER